MIAMKSIVGFAVKSLFQNQKIKDIAPNSPLKMLIIITLLPKFEQRKAPAFADA